MNRKNVVSFVRSKVSYLYAAAFVAMVSLSTGQVFADNNSIDIPDTEIGWSELSQKIMDAVLLPLLIDIVLARDLAVVAVRKLKQPVK